MASPTSGYSSSETSIASPPASPQLLLLDELKTKIAARSIALQGQHELPVRSFRALTVSPISPPPAEAKQESRPRALTASLTLEAVHKHAALRSPIICLNIHRYARKINLLPANPEYQKTDLRDVLTQIKAFVALQKEERAEVALGRALGKGTLDRIGIDPNRLQEILNDLAALPVLATEI